ncbi:MAG: 4-oxalocrotonate tautomerase [endosymbiont of Galathealinum brachiosum]|uniref:4-oxalocrotonate tautomerase n=1 Tax=endosymbiont of Galathealinum brachiosum TaxID=2200906 RepID=A0A370DLW2_9GAMM|nr:MAG: 4-oxalocrotonate tautomerase [endosymbiont of Galathealinum brachiosum]
MPLTITFTEGTLPEGSEKKAVTEMTNTMLKWHGLTGNQVMTSNITAMIQSLPKSQTYSGGEEVSAIWVEWKTPSFAFNNRELQQGYFKEATEIMFEMAAGKVPRNNIYINVVHAVDGAWNFEGEAMSNEEIGNAISNA